MLIHEIGPQSYAKVAGRWAIRPPGARRAAYLSDQHSVTEHEDGTITVQPSISYSEPGRFDYWHGHLIRGKFVRTVKR